MKYEFRGFNVEESFLQPPLFRAECIFTPENNDDKRVLGRLLTGYIVHASSTDSIPSIKNVYFNDPVTVVLWDDGTKTIVRCQKGDTYSEQTGLALCIAKKAMGNKPNFNNIFHKWIPEEKSKKVPTKSKTETKCRCLTCRHNDCDWTEAPCNVCESGNRWESKTMAIPKGCATCKFGNRDSYYPPCRDCDDLFVNWEPKADR